MVFLSFLYSLVLYFEFFCRSNDNACQRGSKNGSQGGSWNDDYDRLRHCKMTGMTRLPEKPATPPECGFQDKHKTNVMQCHVRVPPKERPQINPGNHCNAKVDNAESQPTTDQRYGFYKYYGNLLFLL